VFVVDTNVLVYAADEDAAIHTPCRQLLEEWRSQQAACTSPGVFFTNF
jgi:predicted nucleic acid-binding protein